MHFLLTIFFIIQLKRSFQEQAHFNFFILSLETLCQFAPLRHSHVAFFTCEWLRSKSGLNITTSVVLNCLKNWLCEYQAPAPIHSGLMPASKSPHLRAQLVCARVRPPPSIPARKVIGKITARRSTPFRARIFQHRPTPLGYYMQTALAVASAAGVGRGGN